MDFMRVLREVYGNSLDGIVVADPETHIQEVNAAYEEMTGYSRSEMLGLKTNFLKSGLTPVTTYQEMWQQLNSVGKWVGELINRRKDGSLWYSYLSITRVLDEQGQVSAYVGIARDVSQRRKLEEQLAQNLMELQEARDQADAHSHLLRSILEAVGEGIIMVDNRGTCAAANHLMGELLGMKPEEVQGCSIHHLKQAAAQVFQEPDAMDWKPGRQDADRIMLTTRGEPKRVFQQFSAPVERESGGQIGQLYVYRDVTREAELDQMKTDFTALVAHELRTPMTSIKGALGLLLGGAGGELSDDAREMLEIALHNTERLVRLVNDILDVTRLESGKMVMKRSPLDVSRIAKQAAAELDAFAGERGVRVELELAPNLPRVIADADRIEQVVVNLLSNAIKFSDSGTTVTVRTRQDGRQVWIQVADQGPGIPKDELGRIFEKFHRGPGTRKTQGTGLGLAICKDIVEAHGGRIWAESEPGAGSVFTVTLPLEAACQGALGWVVEAAGVQPQVGEA